MTFSGKKSKPKANGNLSFELLEIAPRENNRQLGMQVTFSDSELTATIITDPEANPVAGSKITAKYVRPSVTYRYKGTITNQFRIYGWYKALPYDSKPSPSPAEMVFIKTSFKKFKGSQPSEHIAAILSTGEDFGSPHAFTGTGGTVDLNKRMLAAIRSGMGIADCNLERDTELFMSDARSILEPRYKEPREDFQADGAMDGEQDLLLRGALRSTTNDGIWKEIVGWLAQAPQRGTHWTYLDGKVSRVEMSRQ